MDKIRRKELGNIAVALYDLYNRAYSVLEQEQEALDGIPESLQCGERYETMEETVDNIETAIDSIEEAIDSITEAMGFE